MPPPKDETAEQREARLVKARKKAANSREEKMVEKYKNKVLEKVKQEEHENEDNDEDDDDDNEAPEKLIKPVKEPKPIKEIIPTPVKEVIPKAKAKKQSKVIIEQSSDDDDVFEDKPNVIFVKRVRPKPLPLEKVEPNPPSGGVPTPPVQQQRPPPPQQQQVQQQVQQQQVPQRPPMTPQRRLELERYINMSQGRFLPISRPR